MKQLLVFLFFTSSFIYSYSQEYTLSEYKEGVYSEDTIYSYFGNFPFEGKGFISVSEEVVLPTGVRFVLVIDTIDHQGAPTSQVVYSNSVVKNKSVGVGDTISLESPISIHSFSPSIGFRILALGMPIIGNELYSCDLHYAWTLGSYWDMHILSDREKACFVDPITALSVLEKTSLNVYPNPAKNFLSIGGVNLDNEKHTILVYDNYGIEKQRFVTSTFEKSELNISQLASGTYLLVIKGEKISYQKTFIVK